MNTTQVTDNDNAQPRNGMFTFSTKSIMHDECIHAANPNPAKKVQLDAKGKLRSSAAEMYENSWKVVKTIDSVSEVHPAKLKCLPVGTTKGVQLCQTLHHHHHTIE